MRPFGHYTRAVVVIFFYLPFSPANAFPVYFAAGGAQNPTRAQQRFSYSLVNMLSMRVCGASVWAAASRSIIPHATAHVTWCVHVNGGFTPNAFAYIICVLREWTHARSQIYGGDGGAPLRNRICMHRVFESWMFSTPVSAPRVLAIRILLTRARSLIQFRAILWCVNTPHRQQRLTVYWFYYNESIETILPCCVMRSNSAPRVSKL